MSKCHKIQTAPQIPNLSISLGNDSLPESSAGYGKTKPRGYSHMVGDDYALNPTEEDIIKENSPDSDNNTITESGSETNSEDSSDSEVLEAETTPEVLEVLNDPICRFYTLQ